MTDQDRVKDRGGEALRKHREKRRAKAAGKGSHHDADGNENSHTASTEGSVIDVENSPESDHEKKQLTAEIVATGPDIEKMRKISKLGFEDPADTVRHNRHKNGRIKDAEIIIATESSREQMRKISMLGLEDPADGIAASASKHSKSGRRKSEREKRPSRSRNSDSRHHTNQSEEPTDFVGLLVGDSGHDADRDIPSPRRRSRSVDNEEPILEVNHRPNRKEKQQRTRSLDLDQCFVPDEGLDFLPFQVTIPQHEAGGQRAGGPKEFGGVIEATKEQQRLMRKVSALGMYDPVFGNIHKDMEVHHASIVFEDMDLNDVPREMRDLLGHTSEHTDVVGYGRSSERNDADMDQIMESPESSKMSGEAASDPSSSLPEQNRRDFVPPLGSFVRRVSRRNLDIPVGAPAITPSPPPPKGIKTHHGHRQKKSDRNSKGSSDSSSSNQNPSSNSYAFIPPTGSFNLRKPGRGRASTPTREALLKDIELAARAQSMFAGDSLLAMSASNLGQSMSNLNASLSSLNFETSATNLEMSVSSMSFTATKKAPLPPAPRNGRSRSPHRRDVYIPPSFPSQPPSDAEESRWSNRRPNTETASHLEQRGKTQNGNQAGRSRGLVRTSSSRSWDGDVDLVDPMAHHPSNPLWSSLSVMKTGDFLAPDNR